MKSKTKTILIFAAILAAVFLIAFLDGGAVQSAADEEEEGTLIGAFVSEEDIDIGGDLAVSAAGKFVWKAGRLYMDTDEDWWALKDRGGGIYCTMEPDARDGEEDAKSPCITNFGTLGAPQGKAAIDNDNGIRTTDIDLSGEVYACGDRQVIFNLYPIIYDNKRYDATSFVEYYLGLSVGFHPMMNDKMYFTKTALYKSPQWKYEKEWRLFLNNNSSTKASCLDIQIKPVAIYYGNDISSINKNILSKIAKEKGIKEYQMYVDVESQEYTMKYRKI